MRALLLAAGFGKRLRPLTRRVPKCLVPIDGKPLLGYWLSLLFDGGVEHVLVNLHWLADEVRAYVESSPYAFRVTTVYEDELLGTGGTILKNRSFFNEDPFMVIHADNLSLFDASSFMERHVNRPSETEITMMTFTATEPSSCGIVEIDSRGIVQSFHEKVANPPGNLANAAVYIVEPSVIAFLSSLEKEVIDFSNDVLPHYLGRMNTFHNRVYHRDIGTLDSLETAEKEYLAVVAKRRA